MAIGDDVARLTREIWRLNQLLGWSQRIGFMDDWDDIGGRMGRIAKAAGATAAQVESWMAGEAQPTVSQALAVLDALPFPAPLVIAAPDGAHP
ncbi:MAG TPA: hypothetical protein VG253_12600 [Streptosporangiaceae bacterium]|nr:hypothetical protein [Streptosporangiaceae bacterium]